MGLLSDVGFRNAPFQIYLNTGTLYDLHTGVYVPGTHGGMVLNGGFTNTNAFVGRPKMFKSTELFSLMTRSMAIYPRSEAAVNDTEFAQKASRIARFAPNYAEYGLEDRIVVTTPAEMSPEEFFDLIKKAVEHRLARKSEYMVDSPILDPRTGSPIQMFIPMYVVFDSWSSMMSSFMINTLDTKQVGSSDTNMIYMKDGNVKKMLMNQLPMLAARAGIYFLLSAHVGNKHEMNQYAPSPKDLPNMKSTDKLKDVGAGFNFVISNASQMAKVSVLQDDSKTDALYPCTGSSNTELNEVVSVLTSCKNNAGGTTLPLVVSQADGILSDLSSYHYIRSNNYFGLVGNKVQHKPAMTDVSLGRTKIREKLQDPEVARAIEILAELCYIQNNWITVGSEIDFSVKPEHMAEQLLGRDSAMIKDILQSRGHWTYDKNNKQPYLSTYDVVAISQNKYTPKHIAVKA